MFCSYPSRSNRIPFEVFWNSIDSNGIFEIFLRTLMFYTSTRPFTFFDAQNSMCICQTYAFANQISITKRTSEKRKIADKIITIKYVDSTNFVNDTKFVHKRKRNRKVRTHWSTLRIEKKSTNPNKWKKKEQQTFQQERKKQLLNEIMSRDHISRYKLKSI